MQAWLKPPKRSIVLVGVVLMALLTFATAGSAASPKAGESVATVKTLAVTAAAASAPGAVAWGSNDAGQLGNAAAIDTQSATPVSVLTTGALAGKTVTAISSGTAHSCAVAGATAYCWGLNSGGQLGTGNKTTSNVPVAVTATGVLSGKAVTAISAGFAHTCAIADGKAYCWGSGADGVLGNGGVADSAVPVAVAGALAGKTVTAISAGKSNTCAVSEGRAYCWGYNANGQLGTGATTDSATPVAVSTAGALAGRTVTAVSVGTVSNTAACAIADSALFCWGSNTTGAVGDGSTTARLTPVAVTGAIGAQAVTDVSVGGYTSCAVAGGKAYCWGLNEFGELGDNTVVNKTAPVAVDASGALAGKVITAISTSAQLTGNTLHPAFGHTCAVASGAAVCWGANQYGQLGSTTTSYQSQTPVAVTATGVLSGGVVVDVAAGAVSSLAMTTNKASTTPGAVVSLAPTRIMDSRLNLGVTGPVRAQTGVSLQILGAGGIPASGVSAVVVNVTVADPESTGFITVYPSGTAMRQTSSLNFRPRQNIANLVIVPVGADGKVMFYNGSGGTVQLVADVSGYVVGGSATLPGSLMPLAPARILETRPAYGGAGAVGNRGEISLQVLGKGGVPASGVSAVIVNVTAAEPVGTGFVTVYPSGTVRQQTSNLNFQPGQNIPNLTVVPVGADGKIRLYNGSDAPLHLVVDVSGYLKGGAASTSGASVSVTPSRILDTRLTSGVVPAAGTITQQVLGKGGVPASGVAAVLLNVTVADPVTIGFITVFPSGTALQQTSSLNFQPRENIANMVLVPVGADGKIALYNGSPGGVSLVVDVAGYILGG
jgi:alpha-tubulin suppressor-like RCC1 family protein